MTTTTHACSNYLCDHDADRPDRLCGPCAASERLLLAVNLALEEFLNDRWPVSMRRMTDLLDDPVNVPDSPLRTTVFEASGHIAHGVHLLIDEAVGQRIYVTSGAYPDPTGWCAGSGWDVSEDQEDDDG